MGGLLIDKQRQGQDGAHGNSNNAYNKSLFPMTLTTATEDVYNELPIDSTLKAPIEINHTTMLGLLADAFILEYARMHNQGKYDEIFTRKEMIAYLNKYWVGVNGQTAFLKDKNTNITVFNQIHHSYKKLIEIMISLPHICNWDGGINLLCSLIRLTRYLHTCKTENRRKKLMQIVKDICDEGMFCIGKFLNFLSLYLLFYFFVFLFWLWLCIM